LHGRDISPPHTAASPQFKGAEAVARFAFARFVHAVRRLFGAIRMGSPMATAMHRGIAHFLFRCPKENIFQGQYC
jgi:hypothetical protein